MIKNELTGVPIVSVQALVTDTASNSERQIAAEAIDSAFRNVGFMYISDHGIDVELVDRARALTREFFLQDQSTKDKIAINQQKIPVRGYQRVGDNVTGGHADWHEAIDFYRELPTNHKLRSTDDPMHSENQWPETPADYTPVLRIYIQRMLELGGKIMEGVARALGLPNNYFAKFYNESYWVMRTIYYPSKESIKGLSNPEDFGCGVHTDYGCLTFINCDDVHGALQVQNRKGEWVNADPIPGTFVVNVGDMLNKWTNGEYRSTPHRVNSVTGSDRVSIAFFFEPNYDARVVPLNSADRQDGVVFGDHLSKRVLSNFKYSPNLESFNLSRQVD